MRWEARYFAIITNLTPQYCHYRSDCQKLEIIIANFIPWDANSLRMHLLWDMGVYGDLQTLRPSSVTSFRDK